MSFIYHAHDHYFCPIGYEICPKRPVDAYKKLSVKFIIQGLKLYNLSKGYRLK